MAVSFKCSMAELIKIDQICERAEALYKKAGAPFHLLSAKMDLACVQAGECPLRLDDLAAADDFNLIHDVSGIARHLNRKTGQLENNFRPRFAMKPLEAEEKIALDKITRNHSAFDTFEDLLNAAGGYRPTIRCNGKGGDERRRLDDAYDRAQEARGDLRRAFR